MNAISKTIDPGKGLQSFLIKPIQRLCRYPLILKELVKTSDPESYAYIEELEHSLEAMKRATDRINELQRKSENHVLKIDLLERMEDWKVHFF